MMRKIYQLVCEGDGGAIVRGAFPDFEVTTQGPTTVIRGVVADPAALEEIIARVQGIGLDLLEMRRLDDADQSASSAPDS